MPSVSDSARKIIAGSRTSNIAEITVKGTRLTGASRIWGKPDVALNAKLGVEVATYAIRVIARRARVTEESGSRGAKEAVQFIHICSDY